MHYCACRDCFEIVYSSNPDEMCFGCKEVGCEENEECQNPDSYGGFLRALADEAKAAAVDPREIEGEEA